MEATMNADYFQFESLLEEICAAEGRDQQHHLDISIIQCNISGSMSFGADDSVAFAETATDNSL